MDEKIEQYIIDIVFATRNPEEYGMTKFKDLDLLWRIAESEYQPGVGGQGLRIYKAHEDT